MKTDESFEFDLQLFSTDRIDEGAADELEELEEEQEPGGGGEPTGDELETEEEEMPDDLLTPEELVARKAERAAQGVEEPDDDARRQQERDTDRSSLVSELREIFAPIAAQRQPPQEREPERKPLEPFKLSPEKAQQITQKILEDPAGIANAIAWAVNEGERRAMLRISGSAEGRASMEASADTFAQNFVARKLNDPTTKFGKATRPVFDQMLSEMDLTPLVSMTREDRNAWFEETWERAGYRAITQKAGTRRPPSPGVARGAGQRPGAPDRGRVVVKLTEQQKKDMRAGSPRLYSGEDGERLFRRHVWEIEHGVTSSPMVRAMTRESVRFSDAVGFGG